MPDFDKNLQSIIKETALPMERIDLTEATPAPRIDVGRSDFSDTTLQKSKNELLLIVFILATTSLPK